MKRRQLIALLAGTSVARPVFTFAQQAGRIFRVGLLTLNSSRSSPPWVAFEQGMRELGYVEGKNWVLEFRSAEGQADRLYELATELVNLPVDVLIASGPEAALRAASQATRTIPIVILAVNYDPLAKGYIDNLARPGGNITGIFFMQVMLSAKRVDLLKKAIPQADQVVVLYDAYSMDELKPLEMAAQSLGIQLSLLELHNPPYDFDNALSTAVQARADALIVLGSPNFFSQRDQLIASALKHRLPAIFQFRHWVERGGFMAYGANLFEMYRYGTSYVDKILQGANPAELPVEQPTNFELVINLKTAKTLGLTLPPSILLQATEVIE